MNSIHHFFVYSDPVLLSWIGYSIPFICIFIIWSIAAVYGEPYSVRQKKREAFIQKHNIRFGKAAFHLQFPEYEWFVPSFAQHFRTKIHFVYEGKYDGLPFSTFYYLWFGLGYEKFIVKVPLHFEWFTVDPAKQRILFPKKYATIPPSWILFLLDDPIVRQMCKEKYINIQCRGDYIIFIRNRYLFVSLAVNESETLLELTKYIVSNLTKKSHNNTIVYHTRLNT